MREWLRLLAERGVDPAQAAAGRWRELPSRALNSWRARRGSSDFSLQVKEAMDGCLACKSCVGQCPIKVDVPAFRARFLEAYHGRYLRPARDYLVAGLESWLPVAARFPRRVNALTHNRVSRACARALGLVALPELDTISLAATLARADVRIASAPALRALTEDERRRSVVVVQDAFTSHYDTRVVLDFCELLQRLGFRPWLAPLRANGKPEHVLGFLRRFERTAARNASLLRELAATGVGLVGVDPSMTLAYRAEYVKALGADAVPDVALPQEWLLRRPDALPQLVGDGSARWALLPHCTERTNAPAATALWAPLAARFGIELQVVASGCCGMAGLYGHQRAHRATSESIYGLSWKPILAEPANAGRTVATGYSCRCQAALVDGVELAHPLQLMLRRLKSSDAAHPKRSRPIAEHHEEIRLRRPPAARGAKGK
jgi:Fe-S oxidoreductase